MEALAYLLVPDSCGKDFRAVAGSANCFFKKFAKTIIFETPRGKKVFLK
jgi:hypothetical protein